MDDATQRSQRRAAAAFLLVATPLAIAIATSGGLLALVPLLAMVVPILAIGRAPGVDALERVRAGVATPRGRREGARSRRPRFTPAPFRSGGVLLADSLAGRGPPPLV